MRRHFPFLAPVILPWEDDTALTPPAVRPARRRLAQGTSTGATSALGESGRLKVAVAGGIGADKGFEVLLACARDAARRDLALEFVLVGYSIDDGRLLETGRVFVTGRFGEAEGVDLIRAQTADLGFVPSVCPETWCYALSLLWRGGLPVVSFDLGAQAERIRRSGAGAVLPLGLPTSRLNDLLLARAEAARRPISPAPISPARN